MGIVAPATGRWKDWGRWHEVTGIATDRLYDRNFFLAMASQTCFVIANTLLTHYARWIEFLDGDLRQIGSIMGIGALFGLLLRPWMAQWIDHLGARAMWAIGYGVFALAAITNLWITDLGVMVYLVRSSLVLGAAIVFASGLTYVSQTTPDHRRTEAIGMFGIGGFLGMMIGPFLGDMFLLDRQRGNFEVLFAVAAIANVVPAIGLCFLRPVENSGPKPSVRLSSFVLTVRRCWPGMILLVDFVFGICMSAPFIFVASFIDHSSLKIEGMSIIGLFFLCYAGIGIVVRASSRRLPDRIGSGKVLLVGMLFMSAGMVAFALVDARHSWLIIVPALLAGTGHSLMFHTMMSLTLQTFPREVRGTGSALALMMLDMGTILGAPVLGLVGQKFGFSALFASIGGLCFAVAIVYAATSVRNSGAAFKSPCQVS